MRAAARPSWLPGTDIPAHLDGRCASRQLTPLSSALQLFAAVQGQIPDHSNKAAKACSQQAFYVSKAIM